MLSVHVHMYKYIYTSDKQCLPPPKSGHPKSYQKVISPRGTLRTTRSDINRGLLTLVYNYGYMGVCFIVIIPQHIWNLILCLIKNNPFLQKSSLVASSYPHPLLKASSPCRAQQGVGWRNSLCTTNQTKHLMGSSQGPTRKTKKSSVLTRVWVITY